MRIENIIRKVAVRAIILDSEDRVLLGLRGKEGSPGYNQWALFGGKPEKREKLREATIREVREETGLRVAVTKHDLFTTTLDTSTTPQDPWLVYFFNARITGGFLQIKLDEHSQAGYFSLEELDKLSMAFNHKTVLARFYRDRVTG